jgi:hypothetical protein
MMPSCGVSGWSAGEVGFEFANVHQYAAGINAQVVVLCSIEPLWP